MIGAFPAFLGVAQVPAALSWSSLLSPGLVSPLLAVARDSRGASYDAAGSLVTVEAGAPRFGHLNGLLIEEGRTNGIRNPRCEGSLAGSPGTPPTNWRINAAHGLTTAVSGSGYEDGIPFVDLKISGTTTQAGTSVNWAPEVAGIIAAAGGETWTTSGYLSVVAGSLSGINAIYLQVGQHAATSTSFLATAITPGTAKLRDARHAYTTTFNKSDMTSTKPLFYLSYASGVAVNVTLRYGAPQMEKGPSASTPILPAVSSPQATTRTIDQASWLRSGGFGAGGTIVAQAVLPQPATATAAQGIWQLDSGGDNSRFFLRNTSGTALVAGLDSASSATSVSLGSLTVVTPFRVAFAWDASGYAASLSGAAARTVQAAGFAPTRLLLGLGSGAGAQALNGQLQLLRHYPARVSDAELASLSTLN